MLWEKLSEKVSSVFRKRGFTNNVLGYFDKLYHTTFNEMTLRTVGRIERLTPSCFYY